MKRTTNNILKSPKYLHNVTTIKVYGDKKIKVCSLGSCRAAGVEDDSRVSLSHTNTVKLDNNVQRARSTLLEYALCNHWDYFVTLTFDRAKVDRYDLKACYKKLRNLINGLNRNYGCKICWLLIPEQHSDGAWHFHGFLSGVPDMCLFDLDDDLPKYIKDKLKRGEKVYKWQSYARKNGYTCCEPIRNAEAASRYVTKYITKDLARSVNKLGDHLYYCSQGLQKAAQTKKGLLVEGNLQTAEACTGHYQSEYCTTYWFDYSPEMVEYLTSVIL